MRLPGFILRVLAVLATLLLVSCIDGREEIWLNADGSGRADVTYSLPAAAARFHGGETGVREMIEGFLKSSEVLIDPICEVTTAGDRLMVHVRASFRSALDLKKMGTEGSLQKLPSSAANLAGDVHLARHGMTLDFMRTISAGKALAGSMFMPASQFRKRKLIYIFHLPTAALDSNATVVSDGGKTLTWEFPLQQAIKAPVVTRFTVKIPIPAWVYPLAWVLVPGLVVTLGAFLQKRLRPSKRR